MIYGTILWGFVELLKNNLNTIVDKLGTKRLHKNITESGYYND